MKIKAVLHGTIFVIRFVWLLFGFSMIRQIWTCKLQNRNNFLHQILYDTIFKGTVMQIEKARINDRLPVSKVSWKFRIPTIYNFAVIYPWNLLFS